MFSKNEILRWACAFLLGAGLVMGGAESAQANESGELIWSATSDEGTALYSIAVDSEGVYVVGNARGGRIEKRDPADGSLLWTQRMEAREGMHITVGSEFLYVAGSPWQVEKRSVSDGSLEWRQQSNGGGKPYGIVVDSEAIYMSGRNGSQWKIEKRSLADGEVIWEQTSTRGVALALAVDSDAVYLGGYETTGGSDRWRLEKRDLEDGSLIWEQTNNLSDGDDKIYGMAVDETGVYAAGYDYAGEGGQWRIEKRDLQDGSLIWEQSNNLSNSLDKAHGLAADSTGLYIPGYENGNLWRIERRSLEDGSIIWAEQSVRGGRLWYAVDTDDEAVYVGGYVSRPSRHWRIEKRAK